MNMYNKKIFFEKLWFILPGDYFIKIFTNDFVKKYISLVHLKDLKIRIQRWY